MNMVLLLLSAYRAKSKCIGGFHINVIYRTLSKLVQSILGIEELEKDNNIMDKRIENLEKVR